MIRRWRFRTTSARIGLILLSFAAASPGAVEGQGHTCALRDRVRTIPSVESSPVFLPSRARIDVDDRRFGVAYALPPDSTLRSVRLLVMRLEDGLHDSGTAPRVVLDDTLRTALPGPVEPGADGCVLENRRPWLALSVIDLDGDARPEVVLESNDVGTCASCLSTVRVYEFTDDRRLLQTIEEPYLRLEMGAGEGVLIHGFLGVGAGPATPVTQSYYRVNRLDLHEFPALPDPVRAVLAAEDCRVPQAWGGDGPHNVVSGNFAAAGQTDWAALCSDGVRSRIVVVWGGAARCPAPVDARTDRDFFSAPTIDGSFFARGIATLPADAVRGWLRAAGSLAGARTFTHDALIDEHYEVASVVLYCHEGGWARLR